MSKFAEYAIWSGVGDACFFVLSIHILFASKRCMEDDDLGSSTDASCVWRKMHEQVGLP